MRQLSSVDTQFLALEDGRNHAHVSTLAIYDQSTAPDGRLTLQAITELIALSTPPANTPPTFSEVRHA